MIKTNTVIIILGPTGVGKTVFSILLAKALNTEIISADSMQVYRCMDVGTAKPSPAELRAVPHHLINILPPEETFSAGLFKEKATEIIKELHRKNKVPLVAGGTGLYLRSLTMGLFEGPGADRQLRKDLMEEEKRLGKGHLFNKLETLDPEAAHKIEPNDLRRIVRALEVCLKERKVISEIRRQSTRASDYDFIKIGLTRDRKELYRLIEERVDRMMKDGLLEETQRLLKMKPDRTAMQALGYKEIRLYIDGKVDLAEAVRLTKKRTKMFAKRQFTWFKKETEINWVDITGVMDAEEIFAKVLNDVKILKKFICQGDDL
ncbi:MAG TPA: tRNA (adenosine(37)-N6)-dimethylallyltransferase MiaA [Nitrospirae bacterium]|nr:tRNA dimethylallyltransferase [bacterium BMS3Abin06]HDH13580.1 tRNA (adenosine(37)-N6)-dimethylallyltransferase MiaA [Nitrospirota bacterium]HDZ00536.1 tRNA (adenosine(37)-N6)-dimethylallyltransferase MiaA [Nitrospirota bacterium]